MNTFENIVKQKDERVVSMAKWTWIIDGLMIEIDSEGRGDHYKEVLESLEAAQVRIYTLLGIQIASNLP